MRQELRMEWDISIKLAKSHGNRKGKRYRYCPIGYAWASGASIGIDTDTITDADTVTWGGGWDLLPGVPWSCSILVRLPKV